MVRGDVRSQSPQLSLSDRRPLLRLTAPRLQLLQHSSGRLPIPAVPLRTGVRIRLTCADGLRRLVSGSVHSDAAVEEKSVCGFDGDSTNCGWNFKMALTEMSDCDWLRRLEIVIVTDVV